MTGVMMGLAVACTRAYLLLCVVGGLGQDDRCGSGS